MEIFGNLSEIYPKFFRAPKKSCQMDIKTLEGYRAGTFSPTNAPTQMSHFLGAMLTK